MHPRLAGALHAFSNQLAIVSLPMPLDPACNHTVQRVHPDHVNACEYARLGLAVWKARPDALLPFDDWIFEPPKPPPLEEVRAYASQLVGSNELVRALADPWVERQLQVSVGIYDVAYRNRRGSMPQLMIGTNLYLGVMSTEELGHRITAAFQTR
jgi:hypothetical protein